MGLFDDGLGGFVSNISGSKNKAHAQGYNVDPNAYQYGGAPGGAEAQSAAYQAQGADAQNRAAPQAATTTANYGQADFDRQLGQQARTGQNTLANIMSQRAQGLAGPSIAQQQADRQMQQAQAQQASLAGSARGAGGLAAAQRNAAFNMANAASDISGQAQINAANERRDDTNAAAGAFANLRGGDLSSQGQSANQAQFQAQNTAQQNQFNAGLQMANRNANDAYQQNYDAMANQVRTTQLASQMNGQAQQSANALGAQGINAGVGGQNANMNQANAMNVVGMAQQGAGVATGALTGKAKGGPTSGGRPYLVGEQGPELIVPQKDGYVLTAPQTREALRGAPAETVLSLMADHPKQATGQTLASIMGARAQGGPVEGSYGTSPMLGVGASQSSQPLSTWGTGTASGAQAPNWDPSALDALQAKLNAQTAGLNATAANVNSTVANIDDRDKDAMFTAGWKERHNKALTPEEEDAAAEAKYRQGLDVQKAKTDQKAVNKRKLTDILTDGAATQKAAAGVDTAYHGGGGHYVPPTLIPLSGARAMGGPISGGGLVPLTSMMGGGGPGGGVGGGVEYGGGGITHDMLLRAGSGLGDPNMMRGMVGGGGITGGASMGGASIPGFGGAREDGGPVEGQPLPKKLYDPTKPEGERFVPTTAGALAKDSGAAAEERLSPREQYTRDTRDESNWYARRLAEAAMSPIQSAGLLTALAVGAVPSGAAATLLERENDEDRKEREERAAIEAERAALTSADRGGGPAVAPKRSLWDILRGK